MPFGRKDRQRFKLVLIEGTLRASLVPMFCRIRLTRVVGILALASTFSACTGRARPAVGSEMAMDGARPYATRLVLALDGLDYRDVLAARERGLFAEFRAPSRLISTFPSISDVAWHDILGVLPPRGYQRVYYSNGYNTMVGTSMDAIRPIEFEDRMDMAFGDKLHHLSAYIASNKVARTEVSTVTRDFFKVKGRSTVYAYNVGPDALQHTRGDFEGYLDHLDAKLLALQHEYHKRTGASLEIVLLSDHGHNHFADAQFIPIARELKTAGFRATDQLLQPNDVAFSVDGVTTGFGVFANADSVPVVAGAIARMDGVELVSYRLRDTQFVVQNNTERAEIDVRVAEGVSTYRYRPLQGDPLRYIAVMTRMAADGALDSIGYAKAAVWLQYSAEQQFPAALERIVRGHTVITLNPAPILVSVATGRQVGLGMVSVANKLRPLGGTHGALSADNSLGIVMTNFVNTHDDVTGDVRYQFGGFADFGDIREPSSGARMTSAALIVRNPRTRWQLPRTVDDSAENELMVDIWLNDDQRAWAAEGGGMYFNLKRAGMANGENSQVAMRYVPLSDHLTELTNGLREDGDGKHFLFALSQLIEMPLAPSRAYTLQIALDRTPTRGTSNASSAGSLTRAVAVLFLRTNAEGRIWPY